MDSNSIQHSGHVSKIEGNYVEISLDGNINCAACHAKNVCGVSNSDIKVIEVHNNTQELSLNEPVAVVMQNSLGLKAVFWGYVLPFIILFSVLIVSSSFVKEWIAGLLALFVLIPYYLILYFNQNTFRKIFTISILKNK